MAVAEAKKKKPPTFHYLPKSRACRLKKSWIEDHKIRSKWKVQKRRQSLTNQPIGAQVETFDRAHDQTNTDSELDTNRPDESSPLAPSHDKPSLRELKRIAYTPKSHPTQKADSPRPKMTSGRPHNSRSDKTAVRRVTSQPNMKLRMNVLLEKIRRDFS